MTEFEKIIKREDFTPAEIFNAYLDYYPSFQMPHKPDYYQSWADNEITRITKYLYNELKTGEQRLKYLSNYIIEDEGITHFLKGNITEHIAKYYNDNEGYSILESLDNITPKDLLEIYTEKIIPFHLSQEILLEEKKYNGRTIPVYQAVNITSSMILAKGLLKLYKQLENEILPSQTPQAADGQPEKKTRKKEPIQKSLSEKMNYTGDDKIFEDIITKIRGHFVNYKNLESALTEGKLTLTGSNKNLDALVIFYTLAETKLIKINNDNYQQILSVFPELDYQTLKTYNNEKLDKPIKSKGINKLNNDTAENDVFINRVNELKKIIFSEKKLK